VSQITQECLPPRKVLNSNQLDNSLPINIVKDDARPVDSRCRGFAHFARWRISECACHGSGFLQ